MNYTMGRFIDGLSDKHRDRLVTAAEFNDGEHWWDGVGCGCLVGTAAGGHPQNGLVDELRRHWSALPQDWHRGIAPWPAAPASIRYPRAVRRFGKARVVRAIKLRAAAGSSRDYEAAPTEVMLTEGI